jgi:tRNA(fMet)-specific endonuclease VapC
MLTFAMLYLLDTNTCIAAMRNHPLVVQRMAAQSPGDCAISTITGYELYTGVAKCANPAKERSKVELLLAVLGELPFDADAAREAARIRAALEVQGSMIGPYDVLLAGHAVSAGLTLVTDNTGEFTRVAGLAVENWKVPAQP